MKKMALTGVMVAMGALAVGPAFAIEISGQPVVQSLGAVRNQVETKLTGALQVTTTTVSTDVANTINCAKTLQLYNKTTGTCIATGGGNGNVVPSDVTGPFVAYYGQGSYTFTPPANYTTLLVYLYGGGAGGGAMTSFMYSPTPSCGGLGGATYFGGYLAANGGGCNVNGAQTGADSYTHPPVAGGGATGGASGFPNIYPGGSGGYAFKKWTRGDAGAPTPGVPLTITVGGGGAGSLSFYYLNYGAAYAGYNGQPGGAGHAYIYWMQSQ